MTIPRIRTGSLAAVILMLAACGNAPERGATDGDGRDGGSRRPASAPASGPAARSTTAALIPAPGRRSCEAEIGAAAAARRVAVCRDVSPATRPPCNAANSCALIEDEIARACALFDGDGAPMAGCGADPMGMEAAADVVRRYYAALDARDFGTAWSQWGDAGRPGQTFAAFEAGFARTRTTRVTIGRLEPGDAGAGSVYQPVPVTVTATLADGTHQRYRGTYVVRRINDVAGAAASQRRWHLASATLVPER